MKKLFVLFFVLSICFGVSGVQSDTLIDAVTLSWDQPNRDNIASWEIYCREQGQEFDFENPSITLAYTGSPQETYYGTTDPFQFTGMPGDEFPVECVAIAVATDGTKSDISNQADKTFTIPLVPITILAPVHFEIRPGALPAPSVSMTATPSAITEGEHSLLEWTSEYSNSMEIDQGIGIVGLNSMFAVYPTEDTTYTITATGPGGTSTDQVTVEVNAPLPSGNNFIDPNCVALWNFDDNNLLVDSIGNNTLGNGGVILDTVDFKRGDASAYFDDSYMGLSDVNLDNGFPFKSGDTNGKISITTWFKIRNFNTSHHQAIYAKYQNPDDLRTFNIAVTYPDQELRMIIGHNNGLDVEVALSGITVNTGQWYHLGATFDDSDGSYRMRVHEEDGTVYESNGNFTNNISVTSADALLGSYSNLTLRLIGNLDEFAVFNDILSANEIDDIFSGTYTP